MTIYVDVLLLSNLWADYALLHAAARLTHSPLPRLRGLLAAMLGAVSSLTVLLPAMPLPICLLGRILLALCICMTAFGRRQIFRHTAAYFTVSLFFCGTVYALSLLRRPVGYYIRNTVIYADISLMTLLFGTAAAAAVSSWFARRAEALPHRQYRLRLRVQGQDFSLPALADTGNTLRDAFTGKPVVVCACEGLSGFLSRYPDAESAAASCRGFRMIPVRTVTGTRLLPAFQPELAAVGYEHAAESPVDVLVALTDEKNTPAIIPACCVK